MHRVKRAHQLLQRSGAAVAVDDPAFRVTRPDELWHLDVAMVWTGAHGWVYPHVAVDCCAREVADWALDSRTRAAEATGCVEQAVLDRASTGPADARGRQRSAIAAREVGFQRT